MDVYVVMSHYDLDYSGVNRIECICLTEEIAKQKEAEWKAIEKERKTNFNRSYWIEEHELDIGNLSLIKNNDDLIIIA